MLATTGVIRSWAASIAWSNFSGILGWTVLVVRLGALAIYAFPVYRYLNAWFILREQYRFRDIHGVWSLLSRGVFVAHAFR